jgi:4-oxalocrotonate tautomerase
MPLAKVHVLEGQYDKARLAKMSEAIQNALIEVLGIPPDDFFQIHHVLPRNRYLHTPAFLGQKYSDDMILLELTFITGRPKETRLALLKSLNEKVVAARQDIPGRPGDHALRDRRRERLIRQRPGAASPHRDPELILRFVRFERVGRILRCQLTQAIA